MFGKKSKDTSKSLDEELADTLEEILNRGKYDPAHRSTRYMCCILLNMSNRKEISYELARHGQNRIMKYLDRNTRYPYHAATLFVTMVSQGDLDRLDQFFEWRIHGSNHFRRLIRQLRSGKLK